MGLAHLMVTSDKGVGALRFLVFRVSRTCAGLASVSVYVYVERGIVVHFSVCMDCASLPPSSLLMVEALCGVGAN